MGMGELSVLLGRGWAYWLKQWAADSSQRSPTTVAPQKCLEPSFRLTCHGTSPAVAPNPPTIRVGFSIAGLAPHSVRGEKRAWCLSSEQEHLSRGGPPDTRCSPWALTGPGKPLPLCRWVIEA